MALGQTHQYLEDLFLKATQHHEKNELDKACKLYQEILEQMPGSPLVNYNYGLALFQLERFKMAYYFFERALVEAPGNPDILYNQALCAKNLYDFKDTVKIYQKILKITPHDVDSLYNLGCCFKDMNKEDKAIESYLKALKIEPYHQSSLNNLAYLYHKNDDLGSATRIYEQLLQVNPEHQSARYMLAALRGETPAAPPPEYIEQVFDDYSGKYEKCLVARLEYNVPDVLYQKFLDIPWKKSKNLKTLDIGCGTGLAGVAFSKQISTIIGIDISKKMIDIAAQKNIYTSLEVCRVEEYVQETKQLFDLFLAADVFTYIGDLTVIFESLKRISEPYASFCFSVETSKSDSYELRNTGRYAHSLQYIEKIYLNTGWKKLAHINTNLRKEKGIWVKGMLFFLQENRGE